MDSGRTADRFGSAGRLATDHQGVSAMLGVWLRDSLISLTMPILSSAAGGGKKEMAKRKNMKGSASPGYVKTAARPRKMSPGRI